MYFLLAGVMESFRFLKLGLAGVLLFVGAKMLFSGVLAIPIGLSLGVIAVLIGGSVAASLLVPAARASRPAEEASAAQRRRLGA